MAHRRPGPPTGGGAPTTPPTRSPPPPASSAPTAPPAPAAWSRRSPATTAAPPPTRPPPPTSPTSAAPPAPTAAGPCAPSPAVSPDQEGGLTMPRPIDGAVRALLEAAHDALDLDALSYPTYRDYLEDHRERASWVLAAINGALAASTLDAEAKLTAMTELLSENAPRGEHNRRRDPGGHLG